MDNSGKPKHLIFLGPPGSGKGTQGKILAKEQGMNYLATGDMVREFLATAKEGDPVGREMKEKYDKGIPQPDDLILKGVREKLKSFDLFQGIIFDSFPHTEQQAWGIEEIVKDFSLEKPLVIYINLSEEESVKRLSQRKYCSNCQSVFYPLSTNYHRNICDKCGQPLIMRSDDKEEIIRFRYKEYINRIEPVVDYYKPRLRWIEINGQQSVEEVQWEIKEKIEQFLAKKG